MSGETAQTAFDTLKEALVKASILHPDFSQSFEIHSDASLLAPRAALIQRDAERVPCCASVYWSQVLKEADMLSNKGPGGPCCRGSCPCTDPYTYGRHFTIWRDHQPLTHVFLQRTKSNRLSHYAHELGEYDFALQY